eukprot:gb/GFBE01010083.1/.p1 GENE.gb/GFBE01010083.1/~~gb/GFBE01010083.1/.p1  ORF type:complete len:607 (+),score=108.62 gb/GFBE01010083.1/:1-1821(+)
MPIEITWQNTLIQAAALLTCVALLVVVVGVIVVAGSPTGPNNGSFNIIDVAIPIVLIVVAFLCVLYVGVLLEKKKLESKLPRVTPFRAFVFLVFGVLVFPVKHLGFALVNYMTVLALVLAVIAHQGGSVGPKLWGVAVCDALFCLGQAEAARRAGAAGDIAAGRFILSLYSALGTMFLPALAIMGTLAFLPKISKAAAVGYAVLALHSAVILLQGLATALRMEIEGGGYSYEGPNCIPSDIGSPLTMVLDLLVSMSQQTRPYEGQIGPQAPCPSNETLALMASLRQEEIEVMPPVPLQTCDSISLMTMLFFLTMGAYGFAVLAFSIYVGQPDKPTKRVVPEGEQAPKRRVAVPGPVKVGICAAIGAGLLALLATIGLQCPPEELGLVPPTKLDAVNATNMSAPITTTTFLPVWGGGRRLAEDNSSNLTNTTIASTNASSDTNASQAVVEAVTTATTTTTVTYTRRICNNTDFAADSALAALDSPKVVCGCSGAGLSGIYGIVSVATTQIATVWCELGMFAPVLLGFVGFLVHGFACSVAVEQSMAHYDEGRRKVLMKGVAIQKVVQNDKGEVKKANDNSIIAWNEAEPDKMPLPTYEVGTSRMFSV